VKVVRIIISSSKLPFLGHSKQEILTPWINIVVCWVQFGNLTAMNPRRTHPRRTPHTFGHTFRRLQMSQVTFPKLKYQNVPFS
jgi:hypothetical protein